MYNQIIGASGKVLLKMVGISKSRLSKTPIKYPFSLLIKTTNFRKSQVFPLFIETALLNI